MFSWTLQVTVNRDVWNENEEEEARLYWTGGRRCRGVCVCVLSIYIEGIVWVLRDVLCAVVPGL